MVGQSEWLAKEWPIRPLNAGPSVQRSNERQIKYLTYFHFGKLEASGDQNIVRTYSGSGKLTSYMQERLPTRKVILKVV